MSGDITAGLRIAERAKLLLDHCVAAEGLDHVLSKTQTVLHLVQCCQQGKNHRSTSPRLNFYSDPFTFMARLPEKTVSLDVNISLSLDVTKLKVESPEKYRRANDHFSPRETVPEAR
jgi:hypothetical protein